MRVCVYACVCSAFSTLPSLFIVEDFLISYLRYSLKLCLLSPLLSSPLSFSSILSLESKFILNENKRKKREEKEEEEREERYFFTSSFVDWKGE